MKCVSVLPVTAGINGRNVRTLCRHSVLCEKCCLSLPVGLLNLMCSEQCVNYMFSYVCEPTVDIYSTFFKYGA